jgi:spore coat protein CotH
MCNCIKNILLFVLLYPLTLQAQESVKLTGTVIGTEKSVDYRTGQPSTTVNTKDMAFDGDLNTYFASYDRSMTWLGLDLGTKHIITRVGWSPRNDMHGEQRVQLALFEGANLPDFSDAVPLYLNDKKGTIGKYQYADINVSRGFRYVRYIGPNNARCNIAEVEFYGYEGEGDNTVFYRPTNLPTVSIHIENNAEPYDKVNELPCMVTLIPADANDTIKTKAATVRLRGNASMSFPKKPYRIKFEKKHHVFGSPASAKKWTLINNYGDKTLMRNILAFETSRRLDMEYTPFCQAVDVFVNGEYKGCYQLCDQIERDKDRVAVEKMDATCINGDELTGGYFVEVDAYAQGEDNYFYSDRGNPVTIKYPSSKDIMPEQTNYITNHFNTMERSLFAYNFNTPMGYKRYLDLDSFLRFFIVGEFTGNTDTFWSVNLYKRRGDEHFYAGPVWDFDLAFENDNRTYPICNHSDYVYTFGSAAGNMKSFANRIIKSDYAASDAMLNIWSYARKSRGMTAESFIEYIDQTANNLNESQRLNFIRWPILNEYVHQNWQVAGTYEGEVEIIKNYVRERFAWMDNKLGFDATGIYDVENNPSANADDVIYTLDGVKVGTKENLLPKGVYIRNGRKFIVK